MKKNLFFLLLLALAMMSCQKDIEQGSIASAVEQPKVDYFNSVTPKPSANDDVMQRIDAFKARLETPANVGAEATQMSIDDAIWGIEAVLNQRYCNASAGFIAQQVDSATFTIPLNISGEIGTNDAASALLSAKRELRARWDRVQSASKHLIVVDISLRSQDISTATFSMSSSIGIEQMLRTQIPPPVPFEFNEFWYDGNQQGRCNGGSQQPDDAATKIAYKWNYRTASQASIYYYTNVASVHITREGSGITQFGSVYINNWLYSSPAVMPICITDIGNSNYPTVKGLNEYLDKVPLFIDFAKPSGKTFVNLYMVGDYEHSSVNIGRFHQAYVYYGIAHANYTPPPGGGGEPPCCN